MEWFIGQSVYRADRRAKWCVSEFCLEKILKRYPGTSPLFIYRAVRFSGNFPGFRFYFLPSLFLDFFYAVNFVFIHSEDRASLPGDADLKKVSWLKRCLSVCRLLLDRFWEIIKAVTQKKGGKENLKKIQSGPRRFTFTWITRRSFVSHFSVFHPTDGTLFLLKLNPFLFYFTKKG